MAVGVVVGNMGLHSYCVSAGFETCSVIAACQFPGLQPPMMAVERDYSWDMVAEIPAVGKILETHSHDQSHSQTEGGLAVTFLVNLELTFFIKALN